VAVVGIDLGTTYSAIAVVGSLGKPEILSNREGQRITPSVVFFQDDMTLVGSMAKRSAPTAPDDVVQFVKRQMGDPNWKFVTTSGRHFTAEEISAIILKRLKDDAEMALGEPVTDAVITVPAYFDDARRTATIDAGVIAGLNVRRVLNEPTAAALAYGLDTGISGTVLVYDLGGGTFDVTVMKIAQGEFDVMATLGNRLLGGFNWDNEIMKYLSEQIQGQGGPDLLEDDLRAAELRDKAEAAKMNLTMMAETKVFMSVDAHHYNVSLSRSTFDELTKGLLSQTQDITEMALEDAGINWTAVDRLLLVGGSTRMPMVQEMIKKISGKEPERSINPDEVVALGAAIQAHLCAVDDGGTGLPVLAGQAAGKVRIRDVCALGLGVLALDGDTGSMRNWILIEHNSKVPAKEGSEFNTIEENQREVKVRITEGDDAHPDYVKIVGEGIFSMPPYPKGAPIDIRLSFDIDGVIHAEVFDAQSGAKLGDMEIERASNLTEEQVEVKRQQVQRLEVN
jgi:molecular chaperone DnaK